TIIAALRAGRVGAPEACGMKLVLWPGEADLVNAHQSSLAFLMELGRWDMCVRYGLLRTMFRDRYIPVMAAQTIQYIRPLRRFRFYQMTTRLACWDERFFFVEHRVERAGKLHAVGFSRELWRSRGRNVPTAEVLAAIGAPAESPPAPPEIESWMLSQRGDALAKAAARRG
ncbi:MAG: thioesterase family protein, partial [Deltaproteobacteria bacterium]|nr:thioesterase family protein [Deltaproteobacteria bacterium]